MRLALLASLALAAAASAQDAPAARAELKNGQGTATGRAEIFEKPHGLLLRVSAEGLAPGFHGLHVHAAGKCEGPAFASAGGHFNPEGRKHGLGAEGQHAGDLPNLSVGADGKATAEFFLGHVALNQLFGPEGTAIVVHAKPDDYATDPSGNSGDRIACGVITKG